MLPKAPSFMPVHDEGAFHALQTLVTGSAFTEHMKESYLDTLRALASTEVSISGIATEVQGKQPKCPEGNTASPLGLKLQHNPGCF